MIAIAVDFRPTYLPVSTSTLTRFFGGLVRNGISRSTDNHLFARNEPGHVVHLHSEKRRAVNQHCDSLRFDFPALEDAFECEFVELPDSVQNAQDFKKWLMEMDFE